MKPLLVVALVLGAVALGAQEETLRLPLAVDGVAAPGFEVHGPPAGVLVGFQLPAEGPLTAWSGVYASLGADGSLGPPQNGAWTGPLPAKWVRVVRPGSVVAGFRVLVRTAPGTVQTRQIQVFWRTWSEGGPTGPVVAGPVYGQKAGASDTVRIVELRVPDDAVATGLYGQILGGTVVQASLVVKRTSTPAVVPTPSRGPEPVAAPDGPTLLGPRAPAPVPSVVTPLLN